MPAAGRARLVAAFRLRRLLGIAAPQTDEIFFIDQTPKNLLRIQPRIVTSLSGRFCESNSEAMVSCWDRGNFGVAVIERSQP